MNPVFPPSPFRFDSEMERLVLRQQLLDEVDPVGDGARDFRLLLLGDPVRVMDQSVGEERRLCHVLPLQVLPRVVGDGAAVQRSQKRLVNVVG